MAGQLQGLVDSIVTSSAGLPSAQQLAAWNPPLSGDIPIVIERDGRWIHDGGVIHREGLVRLFASLLRREDDGCYYLVTPVEKWRLKVVRHALQAIDCEQVDGIWYALLNTGGRCRIGGSTEGKVSDTVPTSGIRGARHGNALRLDEATGGDHQKAPPYIELPNGLTAQLARPAWYRLVDAALTDERGAYLWSGEERINLGALDPC